MFEKLKFPMREDNKKFFIYQAINFICIEIDKFIKINQKEFIRNMRLSFGDLIEIKTDQAEAILFIKYKRSDGRKVEARFQYPRNDIDRYLTTSNIRKTYLADIIIDIHRATYIFATQPDIGVILK